MLEQSLFTEFFLYIMKLQYSYTCKKIAIWGIFVMRNMIPAKHDNVFISTRSAYWFLNISIFKVNANFDKTSSLENPIRFNSLVKLHLISSKNIFGNSLFFLCGSFVLPNIFIVITNKMKNICRKKKLCKIPSFDVLVLFYWII